MKKNNSVSAKVSTLLGKGSIVEGGFKSEESARIDGIINGNVEINGLFVLGVDGKVYGDINAEAALIGGEVYGNIHAINKLEATETARIIGNIHTNLLVIDEHAIFQGNCDMNQEVADVKKAPAKAVKSGKVGRKSAKAALAEALKEVEEENQRDENTATEEAKSAPQTDAPQTTATDSEKEENN